MKDNTKWLGNKTPLTSLRLILVTLLFCAPVFSQHLTVESNPIAKPSRRLDVRVNHLTALSNLIRKYSTSTDELPKDLDSFAQTVNLARQVSKEFGGWNSPAWSAIEIAFSKLDSTSAAFKVAGELPESITSRRGTKIPLRDGARRYADALMQVEGFYLKNIWPEHRAIIQEAEKYITQKFAPKEKEVFAYFTANLGIEDVQSQVPVFLVPAAPWPGGFTLWHSDERIIVISVEDHKGSTLLETLLHEAIHALDVESKGKNNVLVEVHNRLLKAGLTDQDQAVRHGPHWLVFIQAGETVRRFLDISHQHYGQELYIRLQRMSRSDVLAIWTAFLDGKLSRTDAVNEIVAGFLKAHAEGAPQRTLP